MAPPNFDLDSYLDSRDPDPTDPGGFDLDSYLDSKPADPDGFDLNTYIDAKRDPGFGRNIYEMVSRGIDRTVNVAVPRILSGFADTGAAVMGTMRGLQQRRAQAEFRRPGELRTPEGVEIAPTIPERALTGLAEEGFRQVEAGEARMAADPTTGWGTAGEVMAELGTMGLSYMGAGGAGRRLTGMAMRPKPGLMGAAKDVAADVAFAAPLDIATTRRPEDSSANMVAMFSDPERYPEMMANPEGWKQRLASATLPTIHAIASRANETPEGRALFESLTGGAADAVLRAGVAGARGTARQVASLDEMGGVPSPGTGPSLRRRIADVIDPSRSKELEEALFDPKSGLPNERAYQGAMPRLDADPDVETVMIDLQNFKAVNDNISYAAGDAKLGEVGAVIRNVAEQAGVSERNIFRAGGDEFVVAVPKGQGDEVGRAIQEAVGETRVGDTEFSFGARYGVGDTRDAADAAVTAAKDVEPGAHFRSVRQAPDPTQTSLDLAESRGGVEPGGARLEGRDPSSELGGAPASVVGAIGRVGGGALIGGAADASIGLDSPVEGMVIGAALTGAPSLARRLQGTRGVAAASNEVLDNAITQITAAERMAKVTPDPAIDPDDFVNIGKFALDPTGSARLREATTEAVERYGMHPKEVVTWDQTRAVAESLGLDSADLASKLGGRRRASGAEMLAARNVIGQNVDAIDDVLQTIQRGNPDGSPVTKEESKRLDMVLGSLEAQNQTLLGKYLPASSEAGRTLNSMKIAANRSMDPVTWVARAQRALGDDLPAALQGRISQLAKAEDAEELTKLVADLQQSTLGEKISSAWKAGLLSALPTHMVNMISTSTMVGLEAVKDVPATLVDRAISSVIGTARTKNLGSVADQWDSAVRGAQRGVREASAAMSGMPTQSSLGKWDMPRQVNYENKYLDGYVKFVFRSLGAEDRLLAGFTTERSLAEQSRVIANAEGLGGTELAERVAFLTENPSNDMALNAIAASQLSTFTNQGVLGSFVAGGKSKARRLTGTLADTAADATVTAAEFVVPFTMTPANVATRVSEYSPLGAVSTIPDLWKLVSGSIESSDASAVQKRVAERIGRSTVGTAPIALGIWLAHNNRLSLGYPTTQGERGQWQVTGQQENSIRVGGKWHSAERVSPAGNLVILGGYIYDSWTNPDATAWSKIEEPVLSVARTVSEQSFLEGLRQTVESIRGTEREGGRVKLGDRLAGSFVPNVLRRLNRLADPTVRVRETAGEQMLQAAPGASSELPARIDPFGEELRYEGGFVASMLDPFYSRTDKTVGDPVRAMVRELDVSVSGRRKREGETALGFEQRLRVEGDLLYSSIEQLMREPDWQSIEREARRRYRDPNEAQRAIKLIHKAMVEEVISTERGKYTRSQSRARERSQTPEAARTGTGSR